MTFRSTAMSAGHTMTLAIRIALLIFVLSALSLTAVAQSTAGRVLGQSYGPERGLCSWGQGGYH